MFCFCRFLFSDLVNYCIECQNSYTTLHLTAGAPGRYPLSRLISSSVRALCVWWFQTVLPLPLLVIFLKEVN